MKLYKWDTEHTGGPRPDHMSSWPTTPASCPEPASSTVNSRESQTRSSSNNPGRWTVTSITAPNHPDPIHSWQPSYRLSSSQTQDQPQTKPINTPNPSHGMPHLQVACLRLPPVPPIISLQGRHFWKPAFCPHCETFPFPCLPLSFCQNASQ